MVYKVSSSLNDMTDPFWDTRLFLTNSPVMEKTFQTIEKVEGSPDGDQKIL